MKRRKTRAERDHEFFVASNRVWEQFKPRLEALKSFQEAVQLTAETPPPDSPGRKYYSNLSFFLQSFIVPDGSNYVEKSLYLQLIQRLDAAGVLKPGAASKIEADLKRAMGSDEG